MVQKFIAYYRFDSAAGKVGSRARSAEGGGPRSSPASDAQVIAEYPEIESGRKSTASNSPPRC